MLIDEKNSLIYVYGYGNLGRNVYNKLSSMYREHVKGIIVTKIDKRASIAIGEGKKIFEIDSVNLENAVVVIATNSIFHREIKELLKKRGCDILVYDKKMDDYINEHLDTIPLLETRLLNFCVGQACNYKCKDCANFAPYAESRNKKYKVDNIKSDMDKILPFFKEIDKVHIQGGEPFLHSELEEILAYTKKYNGIVKKVQIATNGSFIPSEEVLELLTDNYYEVRISNYKNNTKLEELIEVLKQKGIHYRMYNFADKKGTWTDCGSMEYVAPLKENVESKVARCSWCMCYSVENGMVGRCARSIPALSLQKINAKKTDYLFLNTSIDKQEVDKYFMFINTMECCKYCKGSDGEIIDAAIQIGEDGNE